MKNVQAKADITKNGYQGQINSSDYNDNILPVNTNLLQDITGYVCRIGIFAPPGSYFQLNGDNGPIIEIGSSFMYEADNVNITSLKYKGNKYRWISVTQDNQEVRKINHDGYSYEYDYVNTKPEDIYSLPATNPQRIAIDFIVKTGT